MKKFNGDKLSINGIQVGKPAFFVVKKRTYTNCKECDGKREVNVNYKDTPLRICCPICQGKGLMEESTHVVYAVTVHEIRITKDTLCVCLDGRDDRYTVGESIFANKEDAEEHATHLNNIPRTKS